MDPEQSRPEAKRYSVLMKEIEEGIIRIPKFQSELRARIEPNP